MPAVQALKADLPENIIRKRRLNTKQVAEFIDRSEIEIRRLVKLGKFPKPRPLDGKKWSFVLGDILDFLDAT
jgi:predicted DNA-binding transcriptional regulator AlpA